MRAPRRRNVLLAGVLGVGLLTSACAKKPTEEKCEEFADHLVKLLQESRDKPDPRIRKLANAMRQEVVDSCVQEGTAKEVDCVLAASSILEVEANCK
jgi:hypothetical protein